MLNMPFPLACVLFPRLLAFLCDPCPTDIVPDIDWLWQLLTCCPPCPSEILSPTLILLMSRKELSETPLGLLLLTGDRLTTSFLFKEPWSWKKQRLKKKSLDDTKETICNLFARIIFQVNRQVSSTYYRKLLWTLSVNETMRNCRKICCETSCHHYPVLLVTSIFQALLPPIDHRTPFPLWV